MQLLVLFISLHTLDKPASYQHELEDEQISGKW